MQQQNIHLKNPSDKEYEVWKRTKFFCVWMVWKNPALALAAPWKGHHHCAYCLVRTLDFILPRTGQPCKEESTGCSFPPPITSSLTHHSLQHCQPAFLTQLCRHLSANVFPLFLASFLSFVSAAFMLLTACFLTQGTDFSNGTDFSSYTTSAATATCTDLHALA